MQLAVGQAWLKSIDIVAAGRVRVLSKVGASAGYSLNGMTGKQGNRHFTITTGECHQRKSCRGRQLALVGSRNTGMVGGGNTS